MSMRLGRCFGPGLRWSRSSPAASLHPRLPRPISSWLRPRFHSSTARTARAPPLRRVLLASVSGTTALGAATFVALAQQSNDDEEPSRDKNGRVPTQDEPTETGELRMLEASRKEVRLRVPDELHGLRRWFGQTDMWLDLYLLEPILTTLRFLHLVVIFVPVIAAVPALWMGSRVPPKAGSPSNCRGGERTGSLWWYRFLVASMELAGPAFIKLGQWAASRSDIFPTELCDVMSKLHSNAPAHPIKATRQVLKHAFEGYDLDDIFTEFDENPIGVGAIAQVYRARLRPGLAHGVITAVLDPQTRSRSRSRMVGAPQSSNGDAGREEQGATESPGPYVAVKVLHPRAERTVRRDLRLMAFFAAVLNAIPTMEWLSLPGEVAQFGVMMHLQLDLRIEAANLARFRDNFHDRTTTQFPYPYVHLTSRGVLVEEFAHGVPLADFLHLGGGVFRRRIADEGLDAFLRMVILDSFIHADLHPGNIMVRFYHGSPVRSSPPVPPSTSPSSTDPQPRRKPSSRSLIAIPRLLGQEDGEDVTQQVLERLKPLRDQADPQAWQDELARIEADGFQPQLLFLDAGLVTELNAKNRRDFLDLFQAVAEFDGHRAGELMCERCRQPEAVLSPDVFALRMQHLVLGVRSCTLALGNVSVGDILRDVLGMVRQHHVRVEGDFVNVVISILLLEGAGRALSPDVDLLSSALPILRQLGTRDVAGLAKRGDFGLLMLWFGLEARSIVQATIEDVEKCVKYDLIAPNV